MEKYVDGTIYLKESIPNRLLRFFKRKNEKFVIADAVGVVILKKTIYAFLPKNTDKSKVNLDHLKILVNALKKSSNLLTDIDSGNFELEKSDLTRTIEWLINDFNSNGIYKVVAKSLYSGEKGKIRWDKTLKKKIPFYKKNNLIFTDLIRTQKIVSDNFITQIHEYVLRDLSDNYGEFFDFNFTGISNLKFSLMEINNSLMKQLKIERNIRNKNLIMNLYNYLKLLSSKDSEFYYITREFHILFENALKEFLGHEEQLKSYVPKAKWNLKIDDVRYSSRNTQIPDALVIRGKCIDIYDAKYYSLIDYIKKIGNKSTPLDWYSVGKQFLYDFTFSYEDAGYNPGTNNFVFPAFPIRDSIKNIGNVSLIIRGGSKKINVKLIDTFYLLNRVFSTV